MSMQCKLRPLEAICVAGAVEDCLDRLRVLQSLTPNVLTQRDELSNILGDTVAQIIQQQKRSEQEYEELVKRRSELKSLSNKTRYKKNQERIQEKAQELKMLTTDLCKRLRESPNVSENLLKIQTQRSSLISIFDSFRTELLANRSFQGIAQKAESMKAAYDNMTQVILQEKEMQRQIEELNTNVQRTEQDMQQRLERLEAQIKEQKELLMQKQSDNDAEKAQRDDERDARMAAAIKMNNLAASRLTKQLVAARRGLENERHVHNESMKFFSRSRSKIQQDTQERQEKYDKDTTQEARTLKGLTDRIDKATKEFAVLQPMKEESDRLLKLETVRSIARAKHTEMYAQQVRFLNKIKLVFMLHAKIVPPPVQKKRRGRKS
jgi:DNA repair exonuclease SbcCD ATPase subunit